MTTIYQLSGEELKSVVTGCLKEAVAQIKAIQDPPKLDDRVTLPEAAEITRLSKSMLYKLCMDGTIPFEKYGRKNIFSRRILDNWMQERTTTPFSPEDEMTDRLAKSAKRKG